MIPIASSRQVRPRHLKMLFWGDTGTRKTESILRYFPDVLLIDTEGNAEQCAGMPEVPEFLLAKTKDINDVIQIVDDVAAGRYRFPDGRPVQTLAVDSISVLWTIRKDARALVAEQRSLRWGKSLEDATLTQLDWSMAKRPLIRLNTRLANCPIRYVIYTARLQDKYREDPRNRDRLVKVGEAPEALRGLEYDMNCVLRMRQTEGGWECEVTKVQGALGRALPVGKVLKAFPIQAILDYTSQMTGLPGAEQDEAALAEMSAGQELARESPPAAGALDLEGFYREAQQIGYQTADGDVDRPRIRAILQTHGYRGFSPARSMQMLAVLRRAIEPDKAR